MSEFPKLQAAFELRMQTTAQLIMGQVSPGTGMAVGPIGHGSIKSVAGYGNKKLEGEVVNGADVFYRTPRGVKLDFRSVIRPIEGEMIYFTFVGFIEMNDDTAPVMSGNENATGTSFGSSFLSGSFETGNPEWQFLNDKVFVGSQRLTKASGQPLGVEINLSQVML